MAGNIPVLPLKPGAAGGHSLHCTAEVPPKHGTKGAHLKHQNFPRADTSTGSLHGGNCPAMGISMGTSTTMDLGTEMAQNLSVINSSS